MYTNKHGLILSARGKYIGFGVFNNDVFKAESNNKDREKPKYFSVRVQYDVFFYYSVTKLYKSVLFSSFASYWIKLFLYILKAQFYETATNFISLQKKVNRNYEIYNK